MSGVGTLEVQLESERDLPCYGITSSDQKREILSWLVHSRFITVVRGCIEVSTTKVEQGLYTVEGCRGLHYVFGLVRKPLLPNRCQLIARLESPDSYEATFVNLPVASGL